MKFINFDPSNLSELHSQINEKIFSDIQLILEHKSPDTSTYIKTRSTLFGDEWLHVWEPIILLGAKPNGIILVDNDSEKMLNLTKLKNIIPQILEEQRKIVNAENNYARYIGFYGYISYELARYLEDYDNRGDNNILPLLLFMLPKYYLIMRNGSAKFIQLDGQAVKIQKHLNTATKDINNCAENIKLQTQYHDYIAAIKKIRRYITEGDIYQANFTQSFSLANKNHDYLHLFNSIVHNKRVDYASYIDLTDHKIFSLSPELFLKVCDGKVMTQPIKGTRPRGPTEELDRQLKKELQESEKDNAELSMIVDLLRNDLGRSANPGSVIVKEHAKLNTFENVHHLISTITATIPNSVQKSWELLLRAFPGGSISGVPKIRALEIIEETEIVPREIYTGSIGYMNLFGDLQFNIAIRTAVITEDLITFNAGGGIVYDSDPVEEYIESIHKAKHLAEYFGTSFVGHLTWYNGEIRNVKIDPFEKIGCFETILVENGHPKNLDAHIKRLRAGISYFGLEVDLPMTEEIESFIRLNVANTARLNLFAFKTDKDKSDALMMKINNYTKPSDISLDLRQLDFGIPDEINAGVKSLNYRNYRNITRQAIEKKHWDTLLVADDSVLEGGRCNIYIFTDKWITPENNIVRGIIRQKLIDSGLVHETKVTKEELVNAQEICISNSLIGVLEVESIHDKNNQIWKSQTSKKTKIDNLKNIINEL